MTRGHPRLSSHSGPLRGWGGGGTAWSRAHIGAVTEAAWTAGGARSWDSIAREGTQFNRPALNDSGRAWESRAQTSAPGQCLRYNPHSMGWPLRAVARSRICSLKRPTELPSYPRLTQLTSKRFKCSAAIACVARSLLVFVCSFRAAKPATFQRGEICRKAGI